VSVDTIPGVSGIPLVKELTQPFQKLAYHWVRDPNGTNGSGGFTKPELDSINKDLLKGDPVMYKSTTSNRSNENGVVVASGALPPQSPPVVMAVGHHFVVIENNEAVLDHCFNNAKSGETSHTQGQNPIKAPTPGQSVDASEEANDPPESTEDPPPSKGALKKSTKYISISGLAVQFKSVSFKIACISKADRVTGLPVDYSGRNCYPRSPDSQLTGSWYRCSTV
jgi:hypothetical protein